MIEYFVVLLSTEVERFLDKIDESARFKILYNVNKARFTMDPKLFKKLNNHIWEFRTKYDSKQYRLFAFWDKTKNDKTIVIATHGIIKKSNRTPKTEIQRAIITRDQYFAKTIK